MAYNRRNYFRKCEHALQITRQHYEPGRQDRCYRWVWAKYIRDQFHVGYHTYLTWLQVAREREAARNAGRPSERTLFD